MNKDNAQMATTRPLASADYTAWNAMYIDCNDGTQAMRDKLWAWLLNTNHEVNGLIAIDEADLAIGFIHYRPFPLPFIAETGGFIDDLYVIPNARGNQVAKTLVDAVVTIGQQNNWKGIRWMTDASNQDAQNAYDKFATRTTWVTYDIAPL
jgi:ribosomal protein S18 acetylase RimI-like enzyme